MRGLRVALIQTRTPAFQGAALEHTAPLIEEAVAGGAAFIATPEGSNLLQRSRSKFQESAVEAEHDVFVQGVRDIARARGVTILIGSALVKRADGHFANRSMLIAPDGEVAATYDKIHMFDVTLPGGKVIRESSAYRPGDEAVIATTPWGLLGMSVCYDLRFPQLYRALAKAGAVMLAVPASFQRETGPAHWHTLLRARAIENAAWVIAPAMCGEHPNGRSTYGHSLVIDPWGRIVAELDEQPGVLLAEIDIDQVAKVRGMLPALEHDRSFELQRGE